MIILLLVNMNYAPSRDRASSQRKGLRLARFGKFTDVTQTELSQYLETTPEMNGSFFLEKKFPYNPGNKENR